MAKKSKTPEPELETVGWKETAPRRFTVEYSTQDWARIETELARVQGQTGYPTSVATILRKLVQDHLPGAS